MKIKRNLLAVAVALAATGSAYAGVDSGAASGNGSLIANLHTTATGSSATFDLGFTLSQAQTWNGIAGLQLKWNLATGAFTSNYAPIASNASLGTYGNVLSTFQGTATYLANPNNAQLNVFALDGTDPGFADPLGVHVLSTYNGFGATGGFTALAPSTPNASQLNGAPSNVGVQGFFTGLNSSGNGHGAGVEGASNANSGDADFFTNGSTTLDKFNQSTFFDTSGVYQGATYTSATSPLFGQGKALPFMLVTAAGSGTAKSIFGYDIDGDSAIEFDNNGTGVAGGTEFALWTLQGNELVYTNPGEMAAPIPEPGVYGMLFAGLGLLGFIARRRRIG
jgi:PEP-CTERM motif